MIRIRRPVLLGFLAAALAAGLLLAAPASAAAPTITSFTPTSGVIGTQVTITGTGFSSPATVSIGGGPSGYVSVTSSTKLVASVGGDAATGPITVTTGGGSATSSGTFTVKPGVFLTPAAGPPTTPVNVRFSGFGPNEATDVYLDTADIALITTDGQGAANTTVTIPASATPGTHWISMVGRHSGIAAQTQFLVRTDSPMFGYSPTHRANYSYENVLGPTAVSGLSEAWHSTSYATESSPAIVGGVVYQGFLDNTVRAFDETTGALKWTFATGASVFASPAVVNGVVYVGSTDDYLYALNAATGALRWKYATAGAVGSSPVVSGGIVYTGSNDDDVYALNATTGALVWKFKTGDVVGSTPAVSSGVVYVASFDSNVYALNAASGQLIWTSAVGAQVEGPTVVADGLVFVGGSDYVMHALSASNGIQRWGYPTGKAITGGAAVANGCVYFGSRDGTVYAIGESSGAKVWSTTLPSPLYSGATYADGVLYVGDTYNLYALGTASTGAVLNTLPVATNGYAVVVDGTVTVGDENSGSLVHYTLNTAGADTRHARPDVRTLTPTIRS